MTIALTRTGTTTMAMLTMITVVAGSHQGRLDIATRQADDKERAIDIGSSRHMARPLYTIGVRLSESRQVI